MRVAPTPTSTGFHTTPNFRSHRNRAASCSRARFPAERWQLSPTTSMLTCLYSILFARVPAGHIRLTMIPDP